MREREGRNSVILTTDSSYCQNIAMTHYESMEKHTSHSPSEDVTDYMNCVCVGVGGMVFSFPGHKGMFII